MAEETQSIQNKGLLLVAIILGLVVAVVYNLHIAQVKRAQRGTMVRLLRYRRAMEAGDVVKRDEIEGVEVTVQNARAFGNIVTERQKDIVIGQTLNQSVRAKQWVAMEHTTMGLSLTADQAVTPGKVSVPVEIDARMSPGVMLSAGGRVNLVGRFALSNGPEQTYMIMENVRVLSVGGGAPDTGGIMSGPERAAKAYRTIQIEMDPREHLRLLNVLAHIRGPVSVQVLNRHDPPPETGGGVDDSLKSLADPQPVSRTSRTHR